MILPNTAYCRYTELRDIVCSLFSETTVTVVVPSTFCVEETTGVATIEMIRECFFTFICLFTSVSPFLHSD